MRIVRTLHQSRKGVLGALVLAPLLYAVVALVRPTPAFAASACELVSCSSDAATCHEEGAGVGVCCQVCYNYACDDGTTYSQCRIECGAQC